MKQLLAVCLLAFVTTVHAKQPINPLKGYLGIQYGALELSGDAVNDDIDIDYGVIRIGVTVNENIAIEGRLGTGNDDDRSGGVKYELESIGGVYGLYHFRMNPDVSVYGILGWSAGEVKGSIDTPGGHLSDQEDEDGLSYGAGVELFGVSIEAMRYLDTSEITADAVAVGYTYYFE
jgi:opacity protein-like surface antigen